MASERTRQRDADFSEFVSAQLPTLRRTAYLLCGDSHRADDLVQEAVTKLYVRWHRLGDIERLDRYLRTMLVREFLNERRLSWAKVLLFGKPVYEPEARADDTEQRLAVRAALARVPARQRAVLVLRFLCDLPVDEVALLLGCTAGTVKSQTSHGLATLRGHLGDRVDLIPVLAESRS
ncbi:RNA polymerase sigma24 factor [Catellatospora sp. TT07R-123]|uniref:SigE family RNA polymerase sigma factor n=1 Tax=Catellatospora sp. TT07R-123 TaxID=2733863 RepID=UPI001AFD2C3B|nr:SigE family RNA polymerase sigma factor [Catellatospora sp. TT07R-123]GHJ50206.1 RNA polymerase sigma24 factor [Catellatospora sp. TT07R-123]